MGKERKFSFAVADYHTTMPVRPYPNNPNDFMAFLIDGPPAGLEKVREESEGSGST